MLKLVLYITIIYILITTISATSEVKLQSKKFQKFLLNEISKHFEMLAKDHLNRYLHEIKLPENINSHYKEALQQAINNDEQLEMKSLYIKQWLDVKKQQQHYQRQQQQQQQQQKQQQHQESPNELMYLLRNVQFLNKLKKLLKQLEEESIAELHNLRYYEMCKQFKIKHNERFDYDYQPAPTIKLQPYQNETNFKSKLNNTEKHTIDLKRFGEELYEIVKKSGSDIIDDYLEVIKHLLLDIVITSDITDENNGDETILKHSIALDKIVIEINNLLNISDFYMKRQHLYKYLQNNLTIDIELLHHSAQAEQHLLHVYEKFKEKGMDLIITFLFSNFEFLEELHQQLSYKLPSIPTELFDDKSRLLRDIDLFYNEFKADLENANAYDQYLLATKNLYEATKNANLDTAHIYELLYSAAQNIGALRINIIADTCKEMYEM